MLPQGITFVIDSMFTKMRVYSPLTGLESLMVAPVSKVRRFPPDLATQSTSFALQTSCCMRP